MRNPPLFYTVLRQRGRLEVHGVVSTAYRRWRLQGRGVVFVEQADCLGEYPTRDLAECAAAAVANIDAHYLPELTRLRGQLAIGEANHLLAIEQALEAITPKWEAAA